MTSKSFPPKLTYVTGLALLFAVSFFVGSLAARDQPVQAQAADHSGDLAVPEGDFWCTIGHVGVYENRIHVNCPDHEGSIKYFAYPSSAFEYSRRADRYLAVLNTAVALGKPVVIAYNDSPETNPPGCLASDCRLLTGLAIVP